MAAFFLNGNDGICLRQGIISSASVHSAYLFAEELGRGTFGIVYKGKRKSDGEIVAIKEIPKRRVRNFSQLRNEVKIMSVINHKNVIRLLGAFETAGAMHIALEFCSGGELFKAITADGHPYLTELDVQVTMKQVLEGINACHAARVVHRDLKPQNILLGKPAAHVRDATLKIVDFGISQIFESSSGNVKGVQGTVAYMAPEVFAGERKAYGPKCDLWSLGVICFQLLCGEKPFMNRRDTQIGNWSFGNNFPTTTLECRGFVQKLLVVDATKRLTAAAALKHPWILKGAIATLESSTPSGPPLHTASAVECLRKHLRHRAAKKRLATQAEINPELLAAHFTSLDANGDGVLTAEEIKRAFQLSFPDGSACREAEAIFAELDVDANHQIDYEEFMELARLKSDARAEDRRAEDAFTAFSEAKRRTLTLCTAYNEADRLGKLGRRRAALQKEAEALSSILKELGTSEANVLVEKIAKLGLVSSYAAPSTDRLNRNRLFW